MILVTGAAGKTGLSVINALASRGERVRALVRNESQSKLVQNAGAAETILGDMGDSTTLNVATKDIRAVYHISPNVSQHEVKFGWAIIESSRSSGVNHFVYHSVLHPQVKTMPHHWLKMKVEAALFESNLPYTILQPAAYMQNILAGWVAIREKGVYSIPYSADVKLGLVDLLDVAEAAAIVLTHSNHTGATYELSGPDILTQSQVADLLSKKLNRTVSVTKIHLADWKIAAEESGLKKYQIDTLLKMFQYYEKYGFWGNANVLRWLLGREPSTIADFFDRQIGNVER